MWKILIEQAYFSIRGLSEPRSLEENGPAPEKRVVIDGDHR
jgi:hypothetical protein